MDADGYQCRDRAIEYPAPDPGGPECERVRSDAELDDGRAGCDRVVEDRLHADRAGAAKRHLDGRKQWREQPEYGVPERYRGADADPGHEREPRKPGFRRASGWR